MLSELDMGNRSRLRIVAVAAVAVGASVPTTLYAEAHFRGLGGVGRGTATMYTADAVVSDDGSVVAGNTGPAPGVTNGAVYRWTAATGAQDLGDGGEVDVSGDGSVVVGSMPTAGINSPLVAFRWKQAGGRTSLGDLSPGAGAESRALGVSGNGSVIVGYSSSDSGLQAFRWTAAGGFQGLGDLPGGEFKSFAFGVSHDGSTVVGSGSGATGPSPFRWTAGGGMVGLGGGGAARGVSADGSVVVGGGAQAFFWSERTGRVNLGGLLGGVGESSAEAVTGDGSVVVGYSFTGSNPDPLKQYGAFVWDAGHGMRKLQDVLTDEFGLGDQLTGWVLRGATDVSPDGLHIVGVGSNPAGTEEAWLVDLPHAVPEPGPFAVLVLAPVALLARRRRRA